MVEVTVVSVKSPGSLRQLATYLARDKLALCAALFLLALIACVLLGPLLMGDLAGKLGLRQRNLAPFSLQHGFLYILGADTLGRPILARLIVGAQSTLGIAAAAVFCSMIAGGMLGLIAGYSERWYSHIILRLADVIMSFPSLLLALIVLYTLGPSMTNLVIVLAITRMPIFIRTARAEVLELRERMFVSAARSMGASSTRILFRHIAPLVLPTLVTIGAIDFATVILAESSLSFLGLGIQPPDFTWGAMVANGRGYLASAWWIAFWPGLAILLTTLSLNILASWARTVADPLQRWRLQSPKGSAMTASDKPILSIDNLTVDFLSEGDPVRAVDHVSFNVCPGETLVILGESGSGKSVSTGTVMGLIDCPPGDIVSGSLIFDGKDLSGLDAEGRRELNGRRIAMIFQDPLAYLNPVYTVGRQIVEVFEAHGEAGLVREKVIHLLERVGIPDAQKRIDYYPHQFSGGQRQRVMIAMAIALKPDILIADEPTTALDVSVQAQILELLRDLQRETGMALILITHDLEVAAAMADRIIVMNGGKVVESGKAKDIFTNPVHAYTRRLMSAVPHATAGSRQQGSEVKIDDVKGEILLQVEHLSKHYMLGSGPFSPKREFKAVDDVCFTVRRGETVGIVGESGSGKSSIARMLLRLDEPTIGKALFAEQDIFALEGRALNGFRRRVQMVFQDPFGSMNPRMNVRSIISEPWVIHRDILPKARWKDRVVELLELVGLKAEHADRHPHQFSGGQRQRIAIARALASEPELIVCDEAVSALDVSIQMQVIGLLADLRKKLGLSYVFITHDLPIVREFAHRILVMQQGKVVEEGSTEMLFSAPQHVYTKTLLNSVPRPKWA